MDAVGAFVDRSDTGIAPRLRYAVFRQIAVAAEHLHTQISRFNSGLGAKDLADRREEIDQGRLLPADQFRQCDMGHRARAKGEAPLLVEHSADVRVVGQHRVASVRPPALHTIGGIGRGNRVGTRGVGHALQRHVKPGVVH